MKEATFDARRISLVIGKHDIRFCRTSVSQGLRRQPLERRFQNSCAGASMMDYYLPFHIYDHLPVSNISLSVV
jgi:hypothetical protein